MHFSLLVCLTILPCSCFKSRPCSNKSIFAGCTVIGNIWDNYYHLVIAPFFPKRKLCIKVGLIFAAGEFSFGTMCYFETLEGYRAFLETRSITKWFSFVTIGMLHISVRGGFGTVTFGVLGELLPSNVRGVDTELLTGISRMSFFIVGKIFR